MYLCSFLQSSTSNIVQVDSLQVHGKMVYVVLSLSKMHLTKEFAKKPKQKPFCKNILKILSIYHFKMKVNLTYCIMAVYRFVFVTLLSRRILNSLRHVCLTTKSFWAPLKRSGIVTTVLPWEGMSPVKSVLWGKRCLNRILTMMRWKKEKCCFIQTLPGTCWRMPLTYQK